MKTVKTVEDVFAHFGADYDEAQLLEDNNRWLSRRIYKDTSCGAWGRIEQYLEREKRRRQFRATYQKQEGVWELLSISECEFGCDFPVYDCPEEVRDYFWSPADGMQEFLNEQAQGHNLWCTSIETVDYQVVTGRTVMEFQCGSIVEGCDAEVDASPVRLPCAPDDLDTAIQYVEDEVQRIWNDTHGCDGCQKLCEQEHGAGSWDGAVHPECPECDGDGVPL
jgi:hypothetical protein